MGFGKSRMFAGMMFEQTGPAHRTKADARAAARRLRSRGMMARVTRFKGGWYVWARMKGRS